MEDSNIVRGVSDDTCHELSVKVSNNVRLFGCYHPFAVNPAALPAAAHSIPDAAAAAASAAAAAAAAADHSPSAVVPAAALGAPDADDTSTGSVPYQLMPFTCHRCVSQMTPCPRFILLYHPHSSFQPCAFVKLILYH